jgi:hypothetical protein
MARKAKKMKGAENTEPTPGPTAAPAPPRAAATYGGSSLARVVVLAGIAACVLYMFRIAVPEQWAWVVPTGPRQPMTATTAHARDGSHYVGGLALFILGGLALSLIGPLYRNQSIRRFALWAAFLLLGVHVYFLPNLANLFTLGVLLIGWAIYIDHNEAAEASKKAA